MLNKHQLDAVFSDEPRILCLAGAGTGKTTVLLERISRIVASGVHPENILALTFTNVAAFEMKSRYEKLQHSDVTPEFRTFHSFCYHLLAVDSSIRGKLGYSKVPEIADEVMQKRLKKEAMLQTGVALSEKKLSGKEVLSQQEAYNLMLILKATDRLMKKENVITFDALCKNVCDLFVNDDDIIQKYKDQYTYVFADEYQDTDKLQDSFVKSFKDSNLFVVGDALQNLYAFRGTSSKMIKDLSTDKDWSTIKLSDNYRSTKQICKYANKFSKSYANDSFRIEIESQKDGPEVKILNYQTDRTFRGAVPNSIVKEIVVDSKLHLGSSAILCRTNAEVANIKSHLDDMNVEYNSSNSDNAVDLLKCIYDENYCMSWLASFLPSEGYSHYIREASIKNTEYSLNDFIDIFRSNSTISRNYNIIKQLQEICKSNHVLVNKCKDILHIINKDNMKVNMIDVMKNGNSSEALVNAIISSCETYKDGNSNLYVGTVHSVKGQEYDNVYVLGPSGSSWPLSNEDNNNLFYVAVTRAKTNLTIYFAQ